MTKLRAISHARVACFEDGHAPLFYNGAITYMDDDVNYIFHDETLGFPSIGQKSKLSYICVKADHSRIIRITAAGCGELISFGYIPRRGAK